MLTRVWPHRPAGLDEPLLALRRAADISSVDIGGARAAGSMRPRARVCGACWAVAMSCARKAGDGRARAMKAALVLAAGDQPVSIPVGASVSGRVVSWPRLWYA